MAFKNVTIENLVENPYRDPDAYKYDDIRVESLEESMTKAGGFWQNVMIRELKDGTLQIIYGHHRIKALRNLLEKARKEGNEDFLKEWETCKLNVKNEREVNDDMMLQIFIQENKDVYKDNPQNTCMSMLQVKARLEQKLFAAPNLKSFIESLGHSVNLKMDERAFTRAKNEGEISAATIAQYLGDTWSRPMVVNALQLIDAGEQSEHFRKLAESLPSVTAANKFRQLVTKKSGGETFMIPEKDQTKVQEAITVNNLVRADIEKAIKLTTEDEDTAGDPVKAIKKVVTEKKKEAAEAKKAAKGDPKPPVHPYEKAKAYASQVKNVIGEALSKDPNIFTPGQLKFLADELMEARKPLLAAAKSMAKK